MMLCQRLKLTVNSVFSINDLLQCVVRFRSNFQSFGKARCPSRKKHELLESKLITGMRTTVDNVEGRGWEDIWWLDASELGEVLIQRYALDICELADCD